MNSEFCALKGHFSSDHDRVSGLMREMRAGMKAGSKSPPRGTRLARGGCLGSHVLASLSRREASWKASLGPPWGLMCGRCHTLVTHNLCARRGSVTCRSPRESPARLWGPSALPAPGLELGLSCRARGLGPEDAALSGVMSRQLPWDDMRVSGPLPVCVAPGVQGEPLGWNPGPLMKVWLCVLSQVPAAAGDSRAHHVAFGGLHVTTLSRHWFLGLRPGRLVT